MMTVTDSQIDETIYSLDAAMNGGDNMSEIAPFMEERMAEMRAIVRKLIANGTL